MKRRQFLARTAAASALASMGLPGIARSSPRSWPDRPVKVIVPFPPGGGTDMLARPWVKALGASFGQPFVIENRGGAGSMIGSEAAAKAAPDGYTLLFITRATLSVMPHLRKTPYDPVRSFVPIAQGGDFISGFVINPGVGPRTLPEMIEHARRNPGKLAYGSGGSGTTSHLRIEVLKTRAKVDIVHVPYRGGADALNDLLAGNIALMNEPSTLAHVKAGRLLLLAVNHPTRSPDHPDVPTLTELGYPDSDMPLSYGFYGPAGMPPDIVERLNARLRELAANAEMKARLWQLSVVVPVHTPVEMAAAIEADSRNNRALIETAGIKLD
jgi:tripartite-type tricarboxylate transporter receptor subunit TctC